MTTPSATGVAASNRALRALLIGAAIAALASVAVAAIGVSLALFHGQTAPHAVFGAKTLFPAERITPAFQVGDSSSGAEEDHSSPFAVAEDGLTETTTAWSSAFDVNRYLEFDLNHSLGSGVTVTAATFDVTLASINAGQACFYLEVRQISTSGVLGTYGSAGAPVACVTGTNLTAISTSIPVLASTSVANDLRIRVYASESTAGPILIGQATVSGSTAHQAFTLYPVVYRDAADTTVETTPWALASP